MEGVGQWRKCQNVSHLPGQEFYIICPLSSPWRGNKEINPPLKSSERAFKRFSQYIRVNGIHPVIRSRFIRTLTWGKGQRERWGRGKGCSHGAAQMLTIWQGKAAAWFPVGQMDVMEKEPSETILQATEEGYSSTKGCRDTALSETET